MSSELPPTYNFEGYQGDRKEKVFVFYTRVWDEDANDGEGGWVKGPARDLTGENVRAQIRDGDGGFVGEFVCTKADQTTDRGKLTIRLLPAVSEEIEEGQYLYDIEFTNVTDPTDRDTVLRGYYTHHADVSADV